MSAIETRNAVKSYELDHNVFVQSLLPGGILSRVCIASRYQLLLVPRQVALQLCGLVPYFTLTAPLPSTSTTAEEPSQTALLHHRARVLGLLRRFLDTHLLSFNAVECAGFTTGRGQRGRFSEGLDHVFCAPLKRQVAVLADANPLIPPGSDPSDIMATDLISLPSNLSDSMPSAKGTAPPTSSANCSSGDNNSQSGEATKYPGQLQLFFIDEPLMDRAELKELLNQLKKLDALCKGHSAVEGASSKPGPTSTSPAPTVEELFIDSTAETSAVPPAATAGSSTDATAKRVDEGENSQCDAPESSGGIHLTEEDDEVMVEGDWTPFVSNFIRQSQHQRQLREAAAPTPEKRPASSPATSSPPSSHRDATAAKNRSATTRPESAETAASPAPVLPTASSHSPAPTPPAHPNIVNHHYSREWIKDYRRVVAADNDIHYDEFERIMFQRHSTRLADLISSYVAEQQQQQTPLLSNDSYLAFIEKCNRVIASMRLLSKDTQKKTIVSEGMERYVTSRLYKQLFGVDGEDKWQGKALEEKLIRVERLSPQQLDALPEVEMHHGWSQAMFELDGMNFFKSPREKLRCGMRSCELLSLAVSDILRSRQEKRHSAGAAGQHGGDVGRHSGTAGLPHGPGSSDSSGGNRLLAFGADEFLPCFLLLVLRARPFNFVQNVNYIERYRSSQLMTAEESYCLVTLQSAVVFWMRCTDDGHIIDHSAPSRPARFAAATASPTTTLATGDAASLRQPPVAPAVPVMTEKDLLPSVRNASRMTEQKLLRGTVLPEKPAPTMYDLLFGWTKVDGAASPTCATGAIRKGVVSSPTKTHVTSPLLPFASPPSSPPPSASSAAAAVVPSTSAVVTRRDRVHQLLVGQQKAYEDLSTDELKLIVEEARSMLT